MNDVEARLRGSFARQTMMQTLGAELEEAAEGRTRISAPIAPHVLQQQGFAHAALAFAIGQGSLLGHVHPAMGAAHHGVGR